MHWATDQKALRQIALRQVKGWQKIMEQSLEDEPAVQRQVVRMLLYHGSSDAEAILKKFALTTKDKALKKIIDDNLNSPFNDF